MPKATPKPKPLQIGDVVALTGQPEIPLTIVDYSPFSKQYKCLLITTKGPQKAETLEAPAAALIPYEGDY